jgi:hypothetical protein
MTSEIDILTPSAVVDAAMQGTSAPEEFPAEVQREIRDVQDQMASYVGYPLMATRHTQGIRRYDWLIDETQDDTWRWHADRVPVVEVLSPSGISIRFDEQQLTTDEPDAVHVTYVAGYRRQNQALSDLPTGSGEALDGLTVEPPALPGVIRSVALRLTIARITDVAAGTLGARREAAVGSQDLVTIEGMDRGFEQREMRKLDPYKRHL